MKIKRWYSNLFKRNVNEFKIKVILNEFIKPYINGELIIHFEITRRGVIEIYTNRPGILIGKAGKDIDMLTKRFKEECNAKDVKIYEMKNVVSNCGIY